MRELEGRSYAEIAAILDLSLSAVETLLFRARRALREQLEGALTCGEAEAALSKRLDGRLELADQRMLRAHLRECPECAVLERKQRARRAAVKRLGAVQLPPSLAGFLGGTSSITGGAIAGSGLVAKAAAVVAAGVVAGGVGHEAVQAVAAAEPSRTPLPELRQLSRHFVTPAGAVTAPGAPVEAVQAAVEERTALSSGSTRTVRDRVHAALERPRSGSGAGPGSPETGPAPPSGIPAAAPSFRPPAAPQPVQRAVESARSVVEKVPASTPPVQGGVPPAPPLPLPVPLPPAPPLPVLPPPPPLP
jgi:hypothetical protein